MCDSEVSDTAGDISEYEWESSSEEFDQEELIEALNALKEEETLRLQAQYHAIPKKEDQDSKLCTTTCTSTTLRRVEPKDV